MYILDTSAIQGIARAKLELVAAKADISVSTFSVLELGSHLHEEARYLRARGNFLKCAIPSMLEDPFVLLSQRTGTQANPSRREDQIVLDQLLEAVRQSNTLAELDQKTVTFPDGAVASCKGVGARIASGLANEEAEFVSHIQSLATVIQLDPELNGQHTLLPENLAACLISVIRHLNPGFNGDIQSPAFLATVPYAGYLIHRLYKYANARPINEVTLNVDTNDCEDAYIASCLDICRGDTLVTNDTGTIEALRNTISALNTVLQAPIGSSHVMSNEEFLNAMGIGPSGQASAVP
ncbi:hypothetical protein DR64_3954 [Paraburkholderia xenovorans LB400]|uniref:Uncharacterized protein n=2 Tax=Paraburkholderia TaxID=1822464 RepID=Q13XM0_PARXL|nr:MULTISPECIES: hypothetical protein [Paraburkholderia]ABE31169.1 hypothetical protein Bxe_A1790 [Paraburkholderia xenovorans LB400]AIP30081.1 hypothetical protein DR64_3954 [Paraburkholderia xenovorans LB400]PVX83206.1 hypothetical protein C7402_107112 [Paraburkholderia unamae]